MKLENVLIVVYFLTIVLWLFISIDKEPLSFVRTSFAIAMNLCIIFGIIGYLIGEEEQKKIKEKRKMLEKYLKKNKGEQR